MVATTEACTVLPLEQELLQGRLGRSFYARSALRVARECLGQYLVHQTPEGLVAGRIVEAEAYAGRRDRAAHSFGERRTARTAVMYGPPGHAYVFLVYGLHHQFNLVVAEAGDPQVVLLRALVPTHGLEAMHRRRGGARNLASGPGNLCRALAINLQHYGQDLVDGPLFLSRGPRVHYRASPRVGVDYAGEWAARRFRFFLPDCSAVSGQHRSPQRNSIRESLASGLSSK